MKRYVAGGGGEGSQGKLMSCQAILPDCDATHVFCHIFVSAKDSATA